MLRKKRVAALVTTAAVLMGTASVGSAEATHRPRPQETTFVVTITNVSDGFDFSRSGVFTNPDDSDSPAPAFPGSSYQFEVYANPGDHLSLATMLVQSNDWFFAPLEDGIALYDSAGEPIQGDITEQFYIIDAGTEIDQTPGEGPDQAPRQSGPDTGAPDPDSTVRLVEDAPAVQDLIAVTVEPGGDSSFVVTVSNVSGESVLPGPIAPGVFAVHQASAPLFTLGEADRGEGLEDLVEDGNPALLGEELSGRTGVASPLAPGVYAPTRRRNVFYRRNRPDRGRGLEALAEDGNPSLLVADLQARLRGDVGVFAIPSGSDAPGPLFPGESYEFTVTGRPGERLQVASMFVQSNDWFLATKRQGVRLFRRGQAIDKDITSEFRLLDAGTEVDQAPGFGPDQPPRQSGPNTGADDPNDSVRFVSRDVSSLIQVTIRPAS